MGKESRKFRKIPGKTFDNRTRFERFSHSTTLCMWHECITRRTTSFNLKNNQYLFSFTLNSLWRKINVEIFLKLWENYYFIFNFNRILKFKNLWSHFMSVTSTKWILPPGLQDYFHESQTSRKSHLEYFSCRLTPIKIHFRDHVKPPRNKCRPPRKMLSQRADFIFMSVYPVMKIVSFPWASSTTKIMPFSWVRATGRNTHIKHLILFQHK